MKISKSISELYIFLKKMEAKNTYFNTKDLLDATGWKHSTYKTYWNKGQLADFISDVGEDAYEASNCQNINETEFAKLLSQSKHRRGLGHNYKSKLAKALLRKSKDNMLLALELYNRPSLENRMDAFVMLFCTAWEQLLKAVLIEQFGEEKINRTLSKKGLKETIHHRECLDLVYDKTSKIRKNIETITSIRDRAVHLLMPEIQGIMSRIFQSGVLNFTSQFERFTETPFLKSNHTGMISLVGDFKTPPISVMKATYGDIAKEVIELASGLEHEIHDNNDIEFAIPLNVELVFASKSAEGNIIPIAKADEGMEGLKKGLVAIHKPVDRSKTHLLLQKDAIREINTLIYERYSEEKLSKHLVCTDKKNGKLKINQNCFSAVVLKNKWKQSDNEYHHKNKNPDIHYYSLSLVEEFIKKVMTHEGYLENAKK
jgi:uncharacterized protein DUF3644